MRFTRFERKILAAIIAVALVPMAGALVLGQLVVREAYEVGVNPRVRGELEHGLELYRTHFALLKENANRAADAIAEDAEVQRALAASDAPALDRRLRALTERHRDVAHITVARAGAELARVNVAGRTAGTPRLVELERQAGDATVTVTVAAPSEPFLAYQRAGELVEVFTRLERQGRVVSAFYLVVYMGFLLSVIAVALAMGIVLSRRVTRRVADLAQATERVGAGDLTVQVPTDVKDEVGELTRAFNAMVRDLRESRGRIEYLQRIGAWQEFARRLAHEIKNPLTPIQLAVQELHRRYPGDDPEFRRQLDEALSIVKDEVATLRRLVSEFSDFARLPEAQLEPADLNDFLRDVSRSLEALSELGPDARVTVRWQPADAPLPVRIDAMMLKRCLDNLVRNAIQALRDDPEGGRVEVSASRRDKRAEIEVADSGPGIPVETRQFVFDPYYTTKSDGTGLGLAIVKKVILEHGGEITCSDSNMGGVSFVISVPLALA
jgi:nitrogen fixation/metabolism regulation signal transduction histidine kinase